jgi:hypothetical protein
MSYCVAQHELWCWAFTKTLHGTRPHPDSASGERGPPSSQALAFLPLSISTSTSLPLLQHSIHLDRPSATFQIQT